ncbi:MAG: NADH:ubiquinone oxidoreductase 17.2 kD subunit, partial [uncultured Craurococcus sp.]
CPFCCASNPLSSAARSGPIASAMSITRASRSSRSTTARGAGPSSSRARTRRWSRPSGMPGCTTPPRCRFRRRSATRGRRSTCRTSPARRMPTARPDTTMSAAPGPPAPATTKPGPRAP